MCVLRSLSVLLLFFWYTPPSHGKGALPPPTPRQGQASPAFQNGVVFLATGSYQLAEVCFEHVVREHPGCYEAWAFLGQAQLMRYADGFTEDDLGRYKLGQPAMDGFRRRHVSLEPPVHHKDRRLWWRAYEALYEAVRQNPDWVVSRHYLGLAHLLHPDGPEVDDALAHFEAALAIATTDKDIDHNLHAALLVNLGVVHLAKGDRKAGLEQLERASVLLRRDPPPWGDSRLRNCILYTRAMLVDASDDRSRQEAVAKLEAYLQGDCPLSTWWSLAWARYAEVCQALDREPLSREVLQQKRLQSPPPRLTVQAPPEGDGLLGMRLGTAIEELGPSTATAVLPGRRLERHRFAKHSLEVIATDRVFTVCLPGPNAAVALRAGDRPPTQVRTGMTSAEVAKVLGGEYLLTQLPDQSVAYQYYPDLGLALRMAGDRVVEMILVRTP
jgi:tetratricopeptide (TPR) repeat protein